MFIQTEATPNPRTLKFLPGRDVLGAGSREFADADAALASPLASAVFAIDGVERLIEHDHARILKQEPRKQHALHLPAGQGADGAVLETGQADGGKRLFDARVFAFAEAAEQATGLPQPCTDEIEHRNRETAIDFRRLRQVRNLARCYFSETDFASKRFENSDDAAKQC